ncbi:MAG: hypothetical protein RRB22_11555 [Gammaproteobacteria bacterium]|nr:hypothetical protein [Gammaproteobacteria bacterium]
MKMMRIITIMGLAASLLLGGWCFAAEGHGKSAIAQMAEIMHRLKHYPSPQGKQELQTIISASSTTENERVIARAMMNLEHQASPQDIPLLKKLIDSKASTPQEREIAAIIVNLDHRPTEQDKEKLKTMMQ